MYAATLYLEDHLEVPEDSAFLTRFGLAKSQVTISNVEMFRIILPFQTFILRRLNG
jgi:hypothetical protein